MENLFPENYIQYILDPSTHEATEAMIAFTKFLLTHGLTENNFYLYLKILNKNNKIASDLIFNKRTPKSFFSTLPPSREIIIGALNILVNHRPKILYPKIVLSCLGILQNFYMNSQDGYHHYNLTYSDIQHIGKYLILDEKKINDMAIGILESVWKNSNLSNKNIGILAKEITDHFFDNTKKLIDVIPQNIL